jgi:hypothetical protein
MRGDRSGQHPGAASAVMLGQALWTALWWMVAVTALLHLARALF